MIKLTDRRPGVTKSLAEVRQQLVDQLTAERAQNDATDLADRLSRQISKPADLDAAWDRNTAQAVEKGVFGAPSWVLPTGEIFWGQDRLDFVERALAKPVG